MSLFFVEQVGLRCTLNFSTSSFHLDLSYVIDAYRNLNMDDHFFRSFFELLIGTDYVSKMIKEGKSAEEIKARWKDDEEKFKVQRKPYLLYEE